MKKIALVVIVLSLVSAYPALDKDRQAAADTQLMLSIDHFYTTEDPQLKQIKFYIAATFMYDLPKDWPIIFGYAGPVFSAEQWNFYTLMVGMNDPNGWSIGPSLWVEYTGPNYLFFEADYYVPFVPASVEEDGPAPQHAYYLFGEYSRKINDDLAFGFDWEVYGNVSQTRVSELAYGPFVKAKRVKIWFFRNEAPMEEIIYYGARFKIPL